MWEISPHKREFLVKKNITQHKGIKMSVVECITAVLLGKHTLEGDDMQIV